MNDVPPIAKKFVETYYNAFINRQVHWSKQKGYSEEWSVGTEGPDSYAITVMGEGTTLKDAIKGWQEWKTPRGRRGT